MQRNSFWDSISVFATGLSAAEWAWRIITVVFIGGSGTVSAFIAKADPLFRELGAVYWIGVGIIVSLTVTLVFYSIKCTSLKQAEADYLRVMSIPKHTINPLADSFKDLIIPVEDLRLPRTQSHENKHFKRCKFVGPASLALAGGQTLSSDFIECGDIVALPEGVEMTGITLLLNCTIENCEFIRTSIFVSQGSGRALIEAGMPVKGVLPRVG